MKLREYIVVGVLGVCLLFGLGLGQASEIQEHEKGSAEYEQAFSEFMAVLCQDRSVIAITHEGTRYECEDFR